MQDIVSNRSPRVEPYEQITWEFMGRAVMLMVSPMGAICWAIPGEVILSRVDLAALAVHILFGSPFQGAPVDTGAGRNGSMLEEGGL